MTDRIERPTATRMWALEGPTITMPAGSLVLGETGMVTIPVPVFLIEHPRGRVLFDTGIAVEAVEDQLAVFSEEDLAGATVVYEDRHRPDRQLRAIGVEPADVTHVVMSHLHHDHSGGMVHFPGAQFFVGRDELPHAYWPDPAQLALFRRADKDPVRDFSWNELPGDFDLFGDGSVVILSLPGHTPGSLGLAVRLPSRTFILTGDAVHLRVGLAKLRPMGSDWNTHAAVESIRRLRRLTVALDAELWINHDMEDWQQFTAEGSELW